jgi:hypothetical protein
VTTSLSTVECVRRRRPYRSLPTEPDPPRSTRPDPRANPARGTDDATQALSYLRRFPSVACLNGHVDQLFSKPDGNVTFYSGTTTAVCHGHDGIPVRPLPRSDDERRCRARGPNARADPLQVRRCLASCTPGNVERPSCWRNFSKLTMSTGGCAGLPSASCHGSAHVNLPTALAVDRGLTITHNGNASSEACPKGAAPTGITDGQNPRPPQRGGGSLVGPFGRHHPEPDSGRATVTVPHTPRCPTALGART